MFWPVELASLLILVPYTLSRRPGITFKPLHQGLFIQKQGGLYYQTADWVALITVSSPPPTKQLESLAAALKIEINKVSHRFSQLSENWESRLGWCRNSLHRFTSNRPKRALLGFIGKLSHTLFGTVTEEELTQYRNIIMDTRNSLNITVHRSNLLLSATKTNRNHINTNSNHISRIQRYLTSLQRSVSANFRINSDSIHMLSLKLKIEHVLVSLEQGTHRIMSYYNHRKRQMTSLYHYSLTEDLLSPTQLRSILQQAQRLRYATMPTVWYNENCRVTPVWSSVEDITFKVHLLLHDGKNYFLYSLYSFPFPVKPGFSAVLNVQNKVAYSSSSGLLFEPILCRGTQLQVCRGGPLYEEAKFNCERALVSRNPAATKECQVKVLPSNDTTILEHTPRLCYFYTPYSSQITL